MERLRSRLSFSRKRSESVVELPEGANVPTPTSDYVLTSGKYMDGTYFVRALGFTCRSFPSHLIVYQRGIRKPKHERVDLVRHGTGAEIVQYVLVVIRIEEHFCLILKERGSKRYTIISKAELVSDNPSFYVDFIPKLNFRDYEYFQATLPSKEANVVYEVSLPVY